MREARIIFPVEGPLNYAMQECIRNIIHAFGGATITDGIGHWLHPNGEYLKEIIRVADIAYEPNAENDAKLYDLAHTFQQRTNQVEVYLRYGNGNVQMVTAKSCMDNGEKPPFDWERLNEELRPAVHDDINDVAEVPEHAALELAGGPYNEQN